MKGKLSINNYLESISIKFDDMTMDEVKQVSYYLLQSSEWKERGIDGNLATNMQVEIKKENEGYLFTIMRCNGTSEKVILKKTAMGLAYQSSDNKAYNIVMHVNRVQYSIGEHNKTKELSQKYVTRDEYTLAAGMLQRTSFKTCDELENSVLTGDILESETLKQYAVENFEESAFSNKEEGKYVLRIKK